MIHQLVTMTRKEFGGVASDAIAVLPLGSIEQHGDHLPLYTDAAIVHSLVRESLEIHARKSETPFILAPTLHLGSSDHHLFSVALSLKVETYIAVLKDMIRSLAASGIRRILMINGHGGNDLAMKLVCNDIVLEQDVTVGAFSYWNPDYTPGHDGDIELDHAGTAETSLMLFLGHETRNFDVQGPKDTPLFDKNFGQGVVVNRADEWASIGGVTVSPTNATSEIGAALHRRRAAAMAKTIEIFDEETR